jgi:CheY-like chemotaxis protein
MTVSREEFNGEVANLYRNLYDMIYLRTHPLAEVLTPNPFSSRESRGWQMHHLLVDAIEELNPGPNAPVSSREWRRYQLLMQRYVDGMDPTVVAEEIAVSRRQYFREQKAALDTIADILWNRYVAGEPRRTRDAQTGEAQASLERLELLRLEAARLAQADRYACLSDVVEGVLPLLKEMLASHQLEIRCSITRDMPRVSVDQNLLRQMLLGMLVYLTEQAAEASIAIDAQVDSRAVKLVVSVEPSMAVRSRKRLESQEQLSALQEMATMGGAYIDAMYSGAVVRGFQVHLPVAQRTVLIVDDNEDVLDLLGRYLCSRYHIATARTAEEALVRARQLQPYAITLDLMMPDRDGWDLLQTLLNQPDTRGIPVIVCTVLKQKSLALSLGATAFLEKPVSEQELLSTLQGLDAQQLNP